MWAWPNPRLTACSLRLLRLVFARQGGDDRSGCSCLGSDSPRHRKYVQLGAYSFFCSKTHSMHKGNRHTHQAVELRHWALVTWVTDIPHLDTTLPSCVNVSSGVTDGNSTHHLAMVQCVDLTGVTRNPRAHQSVWGERNRLHLSIGSHVKGIGPGGRRKAVVLRGGKKISLFSSTENVSVSVTPQGDSISLQTDQERQTHLRFATWDPCQTWGHSRNPHVRMRIEANLQKKTHTPTEQTHL